MNVLMITSDLNVLREKSAARVEVEKSAALAKHLLVIVLNTERNRYSVAKLSESFIIVPTNSFSWLFAPLHALFIARRELYFQGKLQADIVVARDAGIAGFAGWLIASRFRTPLLLHIPMNVLSRAYAGLSFGNSCRRTVARFLVKRAQGAAIGNEGTRAALAEISTALADRAMMVPRFMDVESFQKEPVHVDLAAKYPQFKVIMLTVAPLEKQYNVELALTVLSGVLHLYPDMGLVIVGDGSQKSALRSYAVQIGVGERVAFEDWNDNLSSYYKTARIFIVTALYEPYGETIEQAAAASCAIVSTKVGVAPALIEDGVSGFLCDVDDVARFVADVVLMARKPDVCNGIRLNGNLAIQKLLSTDENEHLKFTQGSWEQTIVLAAQAGSGAL